MIEQLFNEIIKKLEFYAVVKEISGSKSKTTTKLHNEIRGMQEAFRIVSGMPFYDYLTNK